MERILLYMSAILLLSACSADKAIEVKNEHCTLLNCADNNVISVSKDGYLVFPTSQSLKDFIENCSNDDTKSSDSPVGTSLKGFESIASLSERLGCSNNCAADSGNETAELSDLEEMTRDEYNLMKAENLLLDDALCHVVDTTLRICVENRLYKITEIGTFSVDMNNSNVLEKTIKNFNPAMEREINWGESITIDNNVKYTKSFVKEFSRELVIGEENYTSMGNKENNSVNDYHKGYNVKSYSWKGKNLVQDFLNSLRGKDVSRHNRFSRNRRIIVNVFDVNYAFYASAGIKVRMQKRKKFLGVPYWKSEMADKIVIGFNRLDGVMKYRDPRSISSIIPSPSRKWECFLGKVNGIQSKFIYGIYHEVPFIKEWTKTILCVMPEYQIGNKNWKEKIGDKLYNLPAEAVYKRLKSLENKFIHSKHLKHIIPEDPKMAYFVWGESSVEFNKERPFITGVKEYNNRKSKSVIFDRSYGASIKYKHISGFLPTEFDIEAIDVFGAAYYDGEWRGVRFYEF